MSDNNSDNTNVVDDERKLHVVVIVLGDVGRSPRMQYHTLSLLQEGHTVSLVGYEGEDLIPDLDNNIEVAFSLNVARFSVPNVLPQFLQTIRPVYFVWRIFSLSLCLCWALMVQVPKRPRIDCLLVQNPPALPLLLVAYLFCWVQGLFRTTTTTRQSSSCRRSRPGLVIDWHNLGYSMLPVGSAFRRWAETYERKIAPLADGHFTVTKAMRDFLLNDFKLSSSSSSSTPKSNNIRVLYDCPPRMFQPLSLQQQHEILLKLDQQLCRNLPASWKNYNAHNKTNSSTTLQQTLLTEQYYNDNDNDKTMHYRPRRDRPALVISSTSWTPDEDFGVLLEALVMLDERIRNNTANNNNNSNLRVLVVVTGKGPQKAFYEEQMSRLVLQYVSVQTLWLEPADYPKLLACADLGVCLHTSTSGLDLPMKVLDLFGCHVPVCAVQFACLSELVHDGVNGRVFETSQQLAQHLWDLLQPLTTASAAVSCHSYGALKEYSLALHNRTRWHENWTTNALPVLLAASSAASSTSTTID